MNYGGCVWVWDGASTMVVVQRARGGRLAPPLHLVVGRACVWQDGAYPTCVVGRACGGRRAPPLHCRARGGRRAPPLQYDSLFLSVGLIQIPGYNSTSIPIFVVATYGNAAAQHQPLIAGLRQ